MLKRQLRAPSPAFVISLVALFIALGGTSLAAINALPKNSVGTKQLKNGAVTGSKIKNRAVTAAKINTKGLTVPSALHASSADSATSATNATHATSADSATSATSATTASNASALGGVGPSGYWPNADSLPAGRTLRGAWTIQFTAAAAGNQMNMPVSFGFMLPSELPITYVATGGSDPKCPGTPTNPQATPGNVCVYEARSINLSSVQTNETVGTFAGSTAARFGFKVLAVAAAAGFMTVEGSWAVTAPTS